MRAASSITSAAAWPKRNLSSPAWAPPPVFWMTVSSTTPRPKNVVSMTPSTVLRSSRAADEMPRIASIASQPVKAAPSMRTSGALLPVAKNARQTPGRAAWAMASPIRPCPRSTAKHPSTPLITPSTAQPSSALSTV